jgi:hypothetical protein
MNHLGEQDEKIDQSLWLHRGDSIITEQRAAKGDLRVDRDEDGAIRHAQVMVRNILNVLWENRNLDDQHAHDGRTYEIWQTIFRAKLSYRNNPIYSPELTAMHQAVKDDHLEVDDYGRLIRSLGAQNCRIIEFAIYEPINEHKIWLVKRNITPYRLAFDTLTTVMERLREEWKERQEKKSA